MASTTVAPREGLFANRWWIVIASLIGMVVGPGTAVIFVTNVFVVPVTTELGWSRGDFTAGLLASAVMSPIMTALFGRLMDRFGIHKVALPAATVYGLALCGFSLIQSNTYWAIFILFGCASGFGACVGPIVYSKAITAWFDKERGLALGIATCGVGLGTFAIPVMAQIFISEFGWRHAYIAVGITTWLVSFAMIAIFVREPAGYHARMSAARADRNAGSSQLFGLTVRESLACYQFWLLFAILGLEGLANNGILSGQFVPLLVDRGYKPLEAAALLGSSGLAAMVARIIVGFCLDYVHGPSFSAAVMLLPVVGVALLLSHAGGSAPFWAAVCLGLAIGAEVDMLGFFVSRYFGARSFGTLYGFIFAVFAMGIGIGPALLGKGYDWFHAYDPILWVYLGLLVVAALLFLPLGTYRYPKGVT
ncbi:MAG TPA: MFS transporter [Stellaceae bacterium]|nr:MFS transporter [Stellaceae bacterium]